MTNREKRQQQHKLLKRKHLRNAIGLMAFLVLATFTLPHAEWFIEGIKVVCAAILEIFILGE